MAGPSYSSDILSCRCRHCGSTFQYVRSDAGANAECPMCRGSVVLPGNLQGVATKRKARVNTRIGLVMEIGGFLLFIWWPIGTVVGATLIFFGWRKNMALRCSNCEEPTTAAATKCSKCHAAFSSD